MLTRSYRRLLWAWCIAFGLVLCIATANAPTAQAQSLIYRVCARPPGIRNDIDRWAYTPSGVPVITKDPMQFATQTAGLPIFVYDPNAAEMALRHLPFFAQKDLKCPIRVLPSTSVLPTKDSVTGGEVLGTSEPTLPMSKSTLPASVLPQKLRTCKASPVASAPASDASDKSDKEDDDDPKLPTVAHSSSGKVPMTAPCGDCKPTGTGQTNQGRNKVTEGIALMSALLNGQMDDINRLDGKPHGIPGGLNPNGPNSAALQAVVGTAGIVLNFVDVGKLFKKALTGAIKKGEPLLIQNVQGLTKEAAAYIAEKEGYAAADALAKNQSIGPYEVMKQFTQKLGHRWETHHIFEDALMRKYGLNPELGPSVVLTKAEHDAITQRLRVEGTKAAKTMEELWQAYQRAYADHPHWLESIKSYFGQ